MFNEYPYKNLEDLNLDYLLKRMRELEKALNIFIGANTLTFANPILWSIASQYEKNIIVLSNSGDAYLSIKPVPAGIQLNNGDYWLEIFNFADYVRTANENLTVNVEQNTTRSEHAYAVDDWLLWDDVLYKVTAPIAVDDLLVINTNVVHFTVEDFIKAWITYANGLIVQYKDDIDASELAYRNQLAQDIANTTSSLQAQLDAAIAGATVDSEVINARIGADGVTYATLGDAIRDQFTDVKSAFDGGVIDILPLVGKFQDKSQSGVTFTAIENGFSVTGTAGAGVFNNIATLTLPNDFLKALDWNYIAVETTNNNLFIRVNCVASDGVTTIDYITPTSNRHYIIPAGTVYLTVRAQVVSGTTYNNDVIKVKWIKNPIKCYPYDILYAGLSEGINDNKTAINMGAIDLLPIYGDFVEKDTNGVLFTPIDNGFVVNGTSTNAFLNLIYAGNLADTAGLKVNDYVYFMVEADSPLYARLNCLRADDSTVDYIEMADNQWYKIPPDTVKFNVQARGISGQTYNNAKIKVRMFHSPFVKQPIIYTGTLEKTDSAMTSGDILELLECHNKKNGEILLRADYASGTIDFELGQGITGAFGSCVEIDDTNYYVYGMQSGVKTLSRTGAHGLTFSDFISLQIFVGEGSHADFILSTSTGSFEFDDFVWFGTSQKPYMKLTTGDFANVNLKYHMGDYTKNVWAYGDSYMTLAVSNRWPYYVTQRGFNPWLIDGYGSRYSSDAIKSFRVEVLRGKPKFILWALGMNDPDSGGVINASWKSCVDEVVAYCKENDIIPILATIPCTPTRDHELKNAYVIASGERYIDFASAVDGLQYGDSWHTGMLSADNVHPTDAGAFALATQAMLDMPELCEK